MLVILNVHIVLLENTVVLALMDVELVQVEPSLSRRVKSVQVVLLVNTLLLHKVLAFLVRLDALAM
jgi:hypothetical protein